MPGSALGEVWDHYQILNTNNFKRHVTCLYCNKEYKYGSAPRLKAHLVKCQYCPEEAKRKFKNQLSTQRVSQPPPPPPPPPPQPPVAIREQRERSPIRTSHAASGENGIDLPNSVQASAPSLENSTNYIQNNDIINIDEKLVRAMYSSGAPLSMLENKYWREALNAANIHIPSRHSISNTLLDAEFNKVRAGVNNLLDNSRALALVIDGWNNVNRKYLMNFILTTPQPVFLKAVYPGTQRSTGEYIGQQVINVIEEIGSTKFVALITDNAASMKAAWRIVKNKYPHISCVGCASHTLNLLCKDIMKIRKFQEIHVKAIKIIKHIIHKATTLANFEKIQEDKYGSIKCTLKIPCATRWSGEVICLNSLRVNKEALQTLAISNVLDPEIRELLLDEYYWIHLDEILSVLQPISDVIKQSESNSATLSDVPEIFSNLEISIRRVIQNTLCLSIEDKNTIKQAITKRKEFCIKPVHLAANYLDPRYRGENLNTSLPAAIEFIGEYARLMYNGNEEKIAEAMGNAYQFKVQSGYYGQSSYMWKTFNWGTPSQWWQAIAPRELIAPIAIRLLSVPPSSAASERNWSLFGATHTEKRNRLDRERLEKLIYIRANLSFLMYDPRAQNENINETDDVDTAVDDVNTTLSNDDDVDETVNVNNVSNLETTSFSDADAEDLLDIGLSNYDLTQEDRDELNNL